MSRVFIPDPDRWVYLMVDGFACFDVLGWRYDPETDTSEPVVSTRVNGGAGVLRVDESYVLLPRWEGVRFGRGVHIKPEEMPENLQRALQWHIKRWREQFGEEV